MLLVTLLAACGQSPPPAPDEPAAPTTPAEEAPETFGLPLPIEPTLYDAMVLVGPIRGVNWVVPNAEELRNVPISLERPRERVTREEVWARFLEAADEAGYRVEQKGKIAKVLKK